MENNRVKILSLKKNVIKIVVKKKSRPKGYFSIIFIMLFVVVFSFGSKDIKSIGVSMSQIYNPVNSLYNDNSDIVFTNGTINGDNLMFFVPIVGNYEIMQDGTIAFTIKNSIMVKSAEAGIVKEIGTTNNGIKYIKIKHSESVWSLIENVDIVGVEKNEIVKRGQDIATAKEGKIVYFQLFDN